MKQLLLLAVSSLFILSVNSQFDHFGKTATLFPYTSGIIGNAESTTIILQSQPGDGKMRAIVFKNQEYCRAELKDFEFDARFDIVSATVYFSGTNFKNVETGFITSSSLKPIKDKMQRCDPGTVVVFDNVKVIGPDKKLRTIDGLSLLLW